MTKKETRIAAIVLAMVVASFALLLHGMQLENRADRLGAMRSVALPSGEHLAVFHANHLHLLDGQGRRVAHQPLKELLLTEEPNDMDWTVDGAGTAHAWFFEDTTPRLVRCTLAPGELRLAGCAQVLSGPSLKVDSASRAVHFAVDGARQRVFIADAKGHKVRVLGLDGRVRADSASGLLFFPNRLRLAPGGGQLIVADNDHRRLVWLDIGSDTPSLAQTRILPLSPHPQASGGRTRAADFAFVGGPGDTLSTLWVLGVAQGQKNGDVLLWGPGLAPLDRADLGGWRDPLVIDTLGGAAVVADFDGIVLYRLGRQGEFLGNFGQGPFAAELEAARQGARAGALWVKLGWASFALTLVVGFLLAWRLRERPGAREVREAFADIARERADIPQRTVRLAPARWYAREAAWAAAAGGLVVLALLAVLWLLLPHEIPPALRHSPKAWLLGVVLVLLFASIPLALWWGLTNAARQLVLKGGQVQVRRRKRTLASAPVREVIASPQALLIGPILLPYRGRNLSGQPGRWIYDQDALTRFLLAHLPDDRRLPHPDLARAAIKRMPRWQKVLAGLAIAAWLAFELWRAFGR